MALSTQTILTQDKLIEAQHLELIHTNMEENTTHSWSESYIRV